MQNFWQISTKTGKIMCISRFLFKCNMLCIQIDVTYQQHWHSEISLFLYFCFVMKYRIVRCLHKKIVGVQLVSNLEIHVEICQGDKRFYLFLPYKYTFSVMNLILINFWTNSAVNSFCTTSKLCLDSITQNISQQIRLFIVFIQAVSTVYTE